MAVSVAFPPTGSKTYREENVLLKERMQPLMELPSLRVGCAFNGNYVFK